MTGLESFNSEKLSGIERNSFNPDKLSEEKLDFNRKAEGFNPDKLSEGKFDFSKTEFQSEYNDRISQTPRNGERGCWTGERGESVYKPSDNEITEKLNKYELSGIEYKNGIPDFSKVSVETLEIGKMTGQREGPGGNFEQADTKLSDKWNKEGRDGRTDWAAGDVRDWRKANGYSWHERNDMKTMDLAPTKIHQYFGHFGGCGECNIRDSKTKEEFDE